MLLLSTPNCWEAVAERCHPARAPREPGIRSSCRNLFAAVAALVVGVAAVVVVVVAELADPGGLAVADLVAAERVGSVAKPEAGRAASCPKEQLLPLRLALDSAGQQQQLHVLVLLANSQVLGFAFGANRYALSRHCCHSVNQQRVRSVW